jgi:hypothetical protein
MSSNETREVAVRNWRSIFLVSTTAVSLAFSSLGASPARATDAIPTEEPWQVAAEAASATPAELKAEIADGELRMIVVRDYQNEPDVSVLNFTNSKQLDQTLKALTNDPSVISVDVDQKVNLLDAAREPTASATAVTAYNQWNYTALGLHQFHTHRNGSGSLVAVIDSGVDRTGTDLNGPGQVLDGCDWVTSPTNVCRGTGVLDENGHGTHVAGIIAAQNDGEGITGVAPEAKILPLRVLDANGSGYLSDISAAVDYAVSNNADVINMSLGGTANYYLIEEAINRAVAAGVVVVAAAGNSGPTNTLPSYPAAYDSVIAVAATDSNGNVASYSNQGTYLDIAAPGSGIISTYRGGYASLSGTSMASPHIAGVVAMMLQAGIPAANIKSQLQSTADNTSPRDNPNRYGAGLVNPYGALGCTNNTCTAPSPEPTPTETLVSTNVINPGLVVAPTPTAEPAPSAPAVTPELAPVVAVPTIKETLKVKTFKKRKLSITVTAPAGSKTWVQRKVGKKWKTVLKITTTPSVQVKLSRTGTYRVQVIAPTEKVISKTYKVK